MTAPTFTNQAIRNLAGRLRAANCEPGTDRDAYDASHVIEQLLRERGALQAKLEHVSHAVDVVGRMSGVPATALAALREALEELPW